MQVYVSSIPRVWLQLQLPLTRTSSGLTMTEDRDLKQHQTPVSMQLAVQAGRSSLDTVTCSIVEPGPRWWASDRQHRPLLNVKRPSTVRGQCACLVQPHKADSA